MCAPSVSPEQSWAGRHLGPGQEFISLERASPPPPRLPSAPPHSGGGVVGGTTHSPSEPGTGMGTCAGGGHWGIGTPESSCQAGPLTCEAFGPHYVIWGCGKGKVKSAEARGHQRGLLRPLPTQRASLLPPQLSEPGPVPQERSRFSPRGNESQAVAAARMAGAARGRRWAGGASPHPSPQVSSGWKTTRLVWGGDHGVPGWASEGHFFCRRGLAVPGLGAHCLLELQAWTTPPPQMPLRGGSDCRSGQPPTPE